MYNGKSESCAERLSKALSIRNMKQADLCNLTGIPKSALSQYVSGAFEPKQNRVYALAKALDVSEAWLMGYDVPMDRMSLNVPNINFISPQISDNTVSIPVIGSIAAGYDEIAVENWSGDTIEIPLSYLKGRDQEEYFVLSVKGDSMYPLYMDGDKVLILRQTTLNRSGEIGAVLYEGENATLKKVEYVNGEDWMRLVPINPEYKPKLIENSDLEQCKILGIPKLLIRET